MRWKSWHRWTAICLLACIYLAVTVAVQRQQDAGSDLEAELIPGTRSRSSPTAAADLTLPRLHTAGHQPRRRRPTRSHRIRLPAGLCPADRKIPDGWGSLR